MEIEQIHAKIEELERERTRILRGMGGRYSYTHRLKVKPDENKSKIKRNAKRIKDVKKRLLNLTDEIYKLRRSLESHSVTMESSAKFNSVYTEVLKEF